MLNSPREIDMALWWPAERRLDTDVLFLLPSTCIFTAFFRSHIIGFLAFVLPFQRACPCLVPPKKRNVLSMVEGGVGGPHNYEHIVS